MSHAMFRAAKVAAPLMMLAFASSKLHAQTPDCAMFGFDASRDSPHVEILQYRYGNSGVQGTFSEPGKPAPQHAGVARPGVQGDRLFVQWRHKGTGKVFSEDVALKGHLPSYSGKCEIFFAVKGDQLYVFLLTQEPRPKDWPLLDTNPEPIVTDYLKAFIVFPYGKKTVE